MELHDGILKVLTKELLDKVAHFGAGDIKDIKKNSEELVQTFQKKISKKYCPSLHQIFFALKCVWPEYTQHVITHDKELVTISGHFLGDWLERHQLLC